MIKLMFIIIASICFQFNSYSLPKDVPISNTYFEKKAVGEIGKAESQILIRDRACSLYSLNDSLYVPVSYLQALGANVHFEEKRVSIGLVDQESVAECEEVEFKSYLAYMNDSPVYIGNLKTYSLLVDQEILVPLDALWMLWDITEYMNQYSIEIKHYDLNKYIKIADEEIANTSSYLLRIKYRDIFWNGKDYKEIDYESILLEPGEVLPRTLKLDTKDKMIHITTVLLDIYGLPNEMDQNNPYGQKNTYLFSTYEKVLRLEQLEKVFVPYLVTGTIKYPVGSFKEKDKVTVWRGEKRQYYVVIDEQNKKITIPWGSVDVVGDLGVKWPQATESQIEDYINLKGMTSETEYFMWTDLYRQRTYVLKKQDNKWKTERIMICSTGRNTYLTPRGEFKLEYRIPYFGMGRGFMCKNAVVIFRDYMYHSILFDKTGQYVKTGKYQLGQRVSHGCIRLSEEDSAWIYKHIPLGTTVWIN